MFIMSATIQSGKQTSFGIFQTHETGYTGAGTAEKPIKEGRGDHLEIRQRM